MSTFIDPVTKHKLTYTKKSDIFIVVDVEPNPNIEGKLFFTSINGFPTTYDLLECGHSFQDIRRIIIGYNVKDIRISNLLFPNVEYVSAVYTPFESGKYLVKKGVLYNTFFQSSEHVINLKNISTICEHAFEGCQAEEVINGDNITSCPKNAFAGYEHIKSDGHVKRVGNIIIDCDAEGKIELKNNTYLCKGIECADTVIVDDILDLNPFSINNMDIKHLVLKDKSKKLSTLSLPTITSSLNVENIEIIGNDDFKSVDGVLYSSDGKRLCCFPAGKTGHYDVKPGTEWIAPEAFRHAQIHSVSFPKSLNHIQKKAFLESSVTEIKLNEGLVDIGDNAFCFCMIDNFELPESLRSIGNAALQNAHKISVKGQAYGVLNSFECINRESAYFVNVYYDGNNFLFPPGNEISITTKEILESMMYTGRLKQIHIINLISNTDIKQRIIKQTMALEYFKINPGDEDVKKYIKRSAKSIAVNMLKSDNDELLIVLIKSGLMTKEQLNTTLKNAEKKNNPVLNAYIIQAINESDDGTDELNI